MSDEPTDGTEVIEPSSPAETENPAPVEQDQDTPVPVSDDNAASGATEDIPETRRDKRIQRLAGDRDAAIEFGKLQQEEAANLRRQLAARDAPEQPAAPVMPKLEDFDYDQDAYNVSLQNFNSHQTATQVKAAVAEAMEQSGQRVAAQQVDASWHANVAEFSKEHGDFAQTAFATAGIYDAIKALPDGPAIAYHLGQNPEEAERIGNLPAAQLPFELGRLNLSSKPAVAQKQVTKAPDPMSPVGGGQPNLSDVDMTINDYMADWRARQAAKRKR